MGSSSWIISRSLCCLVNNSNLEVIVDLFLFLVGLGVKTFVGVYSSSELVFSAVFTSFLVEEIYYLSVKLRLASVLKGD